MKYQNSRRDHEKINPFRTERRERADRVEQEENPRRDFARDEEDHVGYGMRAAERHDWDTEYAHSYNDYDSRREASNRSAYDEERSGWNTERRNDYENIHRYADGRNSMSRPYESNRVGDADRVSPAFRSHSNYGNDYSPDAARAGSFGDSSNADIHYGSDNYSADHLNYSDTRKFDYDRSNEEELTHSYSGRGPKGFTRSDERIKEEICEMLTRNSSVDANDIDVEVKNGEVTLSGSVPDRRMKHLAEDLAEHSYSVKDVINNIRVKKDLSIGKSNH